MNEYINEQINHYYFKADKNEIIGNRISNAQMKRNKLLKNLVTKIFHKKQGEYNAAVKLLCVLTEQTCPFGSKAKPISGESKSICDSSSSKLFQLIQYY